MTGETICDLLRPLLGKPGSISLVVREIGQLGFAIGGTNKVTSVEVRPDGLVRLERESGWTVFDPGEVIAVLWHGDAETSLGQFL